MWVFVGVMLFLIQCFVVSYMFIYFVFYCFFKDTATTEIYTYGHTLSLHDALPICPWLVPCPRLLSFVDFGTKVNVRPIPDGPGHLPRSEEHTSELQSLMRISYAVFCLK